MFCLAYVQLDIFGFTILSDNHTAVNLCTKGTGIINTMFDGYAPYKGDFQYRKQGSLIAFEAGEAVLMVCSQPRSVVLCLSDLVQRFTAVWLSDRTVRQRISS